MEAEKSAQEAKSQARALVFEAEEALVAAQGGRAKRGGTERVAKHSERVKRARGRETTASRLWEQQCSDLAAAVPLLCRAQSQRSGTGWVWAWERNGGRRGTVAEKMAALSHARQFMGCNDATFDACGEGTRAFLLESHSLAASPQALWEALSG